MPRKVVTQRAIESEYHEWHDHHRQNRVARQDREIDWARQAGSLKTRGAVVIVIRKIRNQEKNRDGKRGYLARAVRDNVFRPDETITGQQQHRARTVKTSVQVWQIRDVIRDQSRKKITS